MLNNHIKYPIDVTGIHPDNRIENERHVLQPDQRVIVPREGYYYAASLVVQDNDRVYQINKDYRTDDLNDELTQQTGKAIMTSIVMLNPQIMGEVMITYQCYGTRDNFTKPHLISLIKEATEERIVNWNDIINRPEKYPPSEHRHPLHHIYGWEGAIQNFRDIVQILSHLRYNKDDAIYAYIDTYQRECISRIADIADTLRRYGDVTSLLERTKGEADEMIEDLRREIAALSKQAGIREILEEYEEAIKSWARQQDTAVTSTITGQYGPRIQANETAIEALKRKSDGLVAKTDLTNTLGTYVSKGVLDTKLLNYAPKTSLNDLSAIIDTKMSITTANAKIAEAATQAQWEHITDKPQLWESHPDHTDSKLVSLNGLVKEGTYDLASFNTLSDTPRGVPARDIRYAIIYHAKDRVYQDIFDDKGVRYTRYGKGSGGIYSNWSPWKQEGIFDLRTVEDLNDIDAIGISLIRYGDSSANNPHTVPHDGIGIQMASDAQLTQIISAGYKRHYIRTNDYPPNQAPVWYNEKILTDKNITDLYPNLANSNSRSALYTANYGTPNINMNGRQYADHMTLPTGSHQVINSGEPAQKILVNVDLLGDDTNTHNSHRKVIDADAIMVQGTDKTSDPKYALAFGSEMDLNTGKPVNIQVGRKRAGMYYTSNHTGDIYGDGNRRWKQIADSDNSFIDIGYIKSLDKVQGNRIFSFDESSEGQPAPGTRYDAAGVQFATYRDTSSPNGSSQLSQLLFTSNDGIYYRNNDGWVSDENHGTWSTTRILTENNAVSILNQLGYTSSNGGSGSFDESPHMTDINAIGGNKVFNFSQAATGAPQLSTGDYDAVGIQVASPATGSGLQKTQWLSLGNANHFIRTNDSNDPNSPDWYDERIITDKNISLALPNIDPTHKSIRKFETNDDYATSKSSLDQFEQEGEYDISGIGSLTGGPGGVNMSDQEHLSIKVTRDKVYQTLRVTDGSVYHRVIDKSKTPVKISSWTISSNRYSGWKSLLINPPLPGSSPDAPDHVLSGMYNYGLDLSLTGITTNRVSKIVNRRYMRGPWQNNRHWSAFKPVGDVKQFFVFSRHDRTNEGYSFLATAFDRTNGVSLHIGSGGEAEFQPITVNHDSHDAFLMKRVLDDTCGVRFEDGAGDINQLYGNCVFTIGESTDVSETTFPPIKPDELVDPSLETADGVGIQMQDARGTACQTTQIVSLGYKNHFIRTNDTHGTDPKGQPRYNMGQWKNERVLTDKNFTDIMTNVSVGNSSGGIDEDTVRRLIDEKINNLFNERTIEHTSSSAVIRLDMGLSLNWVIPEIKRPAQVVLSGLRNGQSGYIKVQRNANLIALFRSITPEVPNHENELGAIGEDEVFTYLVTNGTLVVSRFRSPRRT